MANEDNQEWWRGQNFLGRPSSLSLTGDSPGDQSTGAGVLDAGAPVAATGGGAPRASLLNAPSTSSAPASTATPGTSMSPELRALLVGAGILEKGLTFGQPILQALGGGGLAGLTPQDYGIAAQAEFGDAAGQVAGEAGAGLAEAGADVAGTVGSQWAGPIFSAMKAAIDFMGEGKIPFQDIIEMIAPGTFGPSTEWLSFPGRLGKTLQTESEASNKLALQLLNAQSPQDVQNLIASWRSGVGQAIPGFGAGETDPYALPFLPGAGGRGNTSGAHEGPFNVDFSPVLGGLAAEIQAALHGLSPQERIAAFQSGSQPLLDAASAQKAQRQAEYDQWLRTYDPTTGSA